MPRRVSHRLQWSEEVQAYELYDENTSRQLAFDSRGYPCFRGTAGDHKGLVKIPRIFLAQPLFTALAPTVTFPRKDEDPPY